MKVKPRIRAYGKYWRCECECERGFHGYGSTPRLAYLAWRGQFY